MRLARRPLLGTLTYASLVLVLSTCELSKVLSTPAPRKVLLGFPAESTLIMGSGRKPTLQVTIDGEPIIDPEIRFVSSDTSVISIGPRGDSLIARKLGAATITASLQGTLLPDPRPSAADTIYVVPKELTISPSAVTFSALGDSVTLTAVALDANNQAIPNIPVTWESSDPAAVSVSALGVLVAKSNTTGTITVSGKLAGITVTAPVTVAQQLDHFVFTPSRQTLDAIGATVTLEAGGRDRRGNAIAGLTGLEWQSGNGGVLSVTPAGVVTALDNGLSFVRVSRGTITDTVDIDVEQKATNVDIVASAGVAIRAVGGTLRLVARAFDRRDIEVRQKKASWISLDGNVARVDTTGVVEGLAAGNARIIARVDAAVETVTVVVSDEAAALTISPSQATVTSVGSALQLVATVRNALGTTLPSAPVSWSSLDTTIASVSASGQLLARAVGVVRIAAFSGSAADTSLVTITNVPDRVDIIPTTITLASVNDQVSPAVTVANALGVPLDLSTLAWSSDDPLVARVTLTGTIIATGPGTTFIKAVSPGNVTRRDSVIVTVTNAPFTVVLNDDVDTLTAVGRTRGYVADVRNQAGALLIGYPVEYLSTNPSVATVIASTGAVTARGVGIAFIVAQAGTKSDSLLLTVLNAPFSVTLEPPTLAITSIFDSVALKATARNDLDEVIANPSLAWRSTDEAVATVNATGRVAARDVGSTRIIVTAGAQTDTTLVTVTNAPATIDILSDTVRFVSLEDSLAPAATIRNGRGVALPRSSATWSSDDPSIARVSSEGMIVARDVGRTIVRASSAAASDFVVVDVRNVPASLTLNGVRDTLTATGQSITYAATVRNAAGGPAPDATVVWTTTNPAAAIVVAPAPGAPTATVTSVGVGTTLIIATAGAKADTITVVVRNPTRLYVDNSSVASPKVGTADRPYVKIQDAVNAADAFDTVIVRVGSGPYSETVALARRVTLLGDSAEYIAAGRNASRLPIISHDSGSAGIIVSLAPVTIRYMALRHTLDGPAIDDNGGDLTVQYFYVNPGATARAGRGIQLRNSPSSSAILNSDINAVRGYGVRLETVSGASISAVNVTGVDSLPGTSGAGIELVGGSGNLVELSRIRGTRGAQIELNASTSARIRRNNLAGRHQLMRIVGTSGATSVDTNTFVLSSQPEDPDVIGSDIDGRSGLKIATSSNVKVVGNTFNEGLGSRAMDAIHLARVQQVDSVGGTTLVGNRFIGGRYNVRSDTSKWDMQGSHSEGAEYAVVTSFADTVALISDTIVNGTSGCVRIRGARQRFSAERVRFQSCTTSSASAAVAAIHAVGPGGATADQPAVRVTQSTFTGANQTAVFMSPGWRLLMTEDTLQGAPSTAMFSMLGAVHAPIDSVVLTGNIIRGYPDVAGIYGTGRRLVIRDNVLTRNKFGIQSGSWALTPTSTDNEMFDNDTAGVSSSAAITLNDNWWGDHRGTRKSPTLASTSAGDSIIGSVTTTTFRTDPVHVGTVATGLRRMRNIAGVSNTAVVAISVRVVDNQGLPVPLVDVDFSCDVVPCTSSNTVTMRELEASSAFASTTPTTSTRRVQSNASGMAEIRLNINGQSGGSTVVRATTVVGGMTTTVTVDH